MEIIYNPRKIGSKRAVKSHKRYHFDYYKRHNLRSKSPILLYFARRESYYPCLSNCYYPQNKTTLKLSFSNKNDQNNPFYSFLNHSPPSFHKSP